MVLAVNKMTKDQLKQHVLMLAMELTQLEEENKKLKLHIEAKDKAYTALLKDYEELKKDKDEMKAEIGQRLDAIKDLHIRY